MLPQELRPGPRCAHDPARHSARDRRPRARVQLRPPARAAARSSPVQVPLPHAVLFFFAGHLRFQMCCSASRERCSRRRGVHGDHPRSSPPRASSRSSSEQSVPAPGCRGTCACGGPGQRTQGKEILVPVPRPNVDGDVRSSRELKTALRVPAGMELVLMVFTCSSWPAMAPIQRCPPRAPRTCHGLELRGALIFAPPRVDTSVVYLAVPSLGGSRRRRLASQLAVHRRRRRTRRRAVQPVGGLEVGVPGADSTVLLAAAPCSTPERVARRTPRGVVGPRRWGAYGRVRREPVPGARPRIRSRRPSRGQEQAGNDDDELTHFLLEGVLAQVLGRLVPLDLAASWCVCVGERRRRRGQGQGQEGGGGTQAQGDVGRASDRWAHRKIEAEVDFPAGVEC
jgi:hypothetical protein